MQRINEANPVSYIATFARFLSLNITFVSEIMFAPTVVGAAKILAAVSNKMLT